MALFGHSGSAAEGCEDPSSKDQEDCTCRRGVVKYDKGRMHLMPKPLVISVISGMSEIAGESKIIEAVLYLCFSSVL